MKRNQMNREEFLKSAALTGAAGGLLMAPGGVGLDPSALHARVRPSSGNGVVVLIQMAGGNDGLNSVIPYTDDAYYKARPRLGIPKNQVLRINGEAGFHPALKGFHTLYNSGDLAVVQGVGYANPNRSHFRSTEIWQTATDSDETSSTGWLGRYFAAHGNIEDPPPSLTMGGKTPQAFASKRPMGVTLANPGAIRRVRKRGGQTENLSDFSERIFPDIDEDMDGGSIAAIAGALRGDINPLTFLEQAYDGTDKAYARIADLMNKVPAGQGYPNSKLGRDLGFVARMIAGELPARVYYLSIGGFDTHVNQRGNHERLLTQLGDAVNAFVRDLKRRGKYNNVALLAFSEFGRRVKENASGGTDHGTAAPVYLTGGLVKGGVYGKQPSLTDLDRGDLKFNLDYRRVYATLLEKGLGVSSRSILRGGYDTLPVM